MKEKFQLFRVPALTALVALVASTGATASKAAALQSIAYIPGHDSTIVCPFDPQQNAGYECEIVLARGERVNDGLNAEAPQWDPHVIYDGDPQGGLDVLRPHLVLRPARLGLRTNVLLTTSRHRTYRILFVSDAGTEPAYYAYNYAAEERARNLANSMHELALRAVATQAALRAQAAAGAAAGPKISPLADLTTRCTPGSDYYADAPTGGKDARILHEPPNQRPPFAPARVCHDDVHTYVQFPTPIVAPVDVPVLHAVTDEGDTLINASFDPTLGRYTTDGVYDELVLVSGSQRSPVRLLLHRYAPATSKRGHR